MVNKYKAAVRFSDGSKGLYDVTAESISHAREIVLRDVDDVGSVVVVCNDNEGEE